MSKELNFCILLDFYGSLLSERQQELMHCYYNLDYSLGEIAQDSGITRQGVRDAIKKAEKFLQDTEEKLRLLERFTFITKKLDSMEAGIAALLPEASPETKKALLAILSEIETIRE